MADNNSTGDDDADAVIAQMSGNGASASTASKSSSSTGDSDADAVIHAMENPIESALDKGLADYHKGIAEHSDRAQSLVSGMNSNIVNLAGLPMDTATNAANLVKAGIGYPWSKITGKAPPEALEVSDPATVPGTSEWLKNKIRDAGGANLIDASSGTPGNRMLHTAGEVVGPATLLAENPASAEAVAAREAAAIPPGAQRIEPTMGPPGTGMNSPQSLSAAAAAPALEGASPELKQAITKAKNPDPEVFQRHLIVDTLPLPEGTSPTPLRKGQATQDAQQISDEKNLRADPDTLGLLSDSITNQDKMLGASMGEIRRRANPDIVQRSNGDHGQANIDAIKTQDNAAVLDTRAKYKALEDAAGGSMPIDTGTTISQIKDGLKQKLLTKTASENPAISEVMDTLSSGQPISFETFSNALSNLAEVQRNKGSPAVAATVVRNALESMPLTEQAAGLKGLRDIAASAAKRRFDTIEQNPAYEAAINDNVPKNSKNLHVIGAPSPLADTFMDRYYLGNGPNASRAYVSRIKNIMGNNPDFAPSIEASALNKLRDSAGLDIFDNGSFRNASYRNARNAMENKADVLMSPQSAAHTEQLKQASGLINDEGKSSTTNRSNTALTLQRFGAQYPASPTLAGTLTDYGTDLAAAHTGPFGYAATKIGKGILKGRQDARALQSMKDAKLKFAQEAVAPGAGVDRIGPSQANP